MLKNNIPSRSHRDLLVIFAIIAILFVLSTAAGSRSAAFSFVGHAAEFFAPQSDEPSKLSQVSCAEQPGGMVTWWPGDGNANDVKGPTFENGALFNGAAYAPGKVGQAFSLDGVNDYVAMPGNANWAFGTGDFTVQFWMYSTTNDDRRPLVNNRRGPGGIPNMWAVEIYNVANRVEFHSGTTILLTATTLLTNSSWNHVAVTRTGTTLSMFINGAPAGTTTNSDNFSEVNDLQIGRDLLPIPIGDLGGKYFQGSIDELAIFNRGLSATEIASIYNAGTSGICRLCVTAPAEMTAWWPGEGNGLDVQGPTLENGTVLGTTIYTAAKVGTGFTFDSNDDGVTVPHNTNLDVNGTGFTAAFWMSGTHSQPESLHTVLEKSHGWTDSTGWVFQGSSSSGIMQFGIGAGGPTTNNYPVVSSLGDLLDGNFHHVVGTWDGSNIRLYVDGVLQGSTPLTQPVNNTRSVNVGYTWGAGYGRQRQFRGTIDEVEIFGRALSNSEISLIYGAGDSGYCRTCAAPPAEMIAWWPGNGNANDIVGNMTGAVFGNTTYAPGKVDRAFSMDGDGDYVDVTIPSVNTTPGTDVTVNFWMYWTGQVSAVGNMPFGFSQYDLYFFGTGFGFNTAQSDVWGIPSAGLANRWVHVAAIFHNGISTGSKLFIDGVEQTLSAQNGTPGTGTVTTNARIGGWRFNTDYSFPGMVDEVEVFNRALTATEIQANYNTGSAGHCFACTAPPPNMMSWWTAEGNGVDIQSGYNGTLKGTAAYAPGKVGQAFSFDGSQGGYFELDNSAAFNPAGAFSIDGWFYIDPAAAGNVGEIGTLIGKSEGSTGNGMAIYFDDRSGVGASKALKLAVGDVYTANNAILTAGWYHIAATYNPAAAVRAKLFVNSVLVVDSGTNQAGYNPNGLPFRIGAMNWTDTYGQGNDRLNGKADEVEFFTRALTETEIQSIFNAGASGKCLPDAGKAYVANAGDETVSVIDIGTGRVSATIATGSPRNPSFIAVSNDGTRVYVPHVYSAEITVIDTSTNTVIGTYNTPGSMHGLAVNAAGTRLYTTQRDGSNVWVLDAASGALLATVPVGPNPFAIAAAPDGKYVYVTNYNGASVSAIKTSDNSVVTIATGSVPYGIAVTPDSSKVFVSNNGSSTVSVIDAATFDLVNIPFSQPTGVGVNKAGTRAYVGSGSNDVLSIDTATNIGTPIPVGRPTQGISVTQDGSRVFAAAATSNLAVSINTATNTVTNIPVGGAPYSMGVFIAQNLPAATAPAPACAARPAGITSWWRGEGNTLDQRKAHFASLVNGTTMPAALAGRGFGLDGTDDYVLVPAFNMGTDWTVEGWINPAACSDNLHCSLFSRSNGNQEGLWIGYVGNGHPWNNEFAFDIGDGTAWQVTLRSATKYSMGTWYHVAATKSGDTYTLYVNGAKRAQQTVAGVSTQYQTRDIWLGRWAYSSTANLQGKIDEVAVYKRALTAPEVTSIYNADSFGKCVGTQTMADMDGDQSSDLSVFRPSGANGAEWWWLKSTGGNGAVQFGVSTDTIVASDYTGDGKTDVAFWRPSTGQWYILRSEDFSFYAFPFGGTGDIPAPADYDGDGKTDATVFRPSTKTWYINKTTGGTGITVFGATGDKPVPEDYDGDGKADIAVFRPNGTGGAEWWIAQSSGGVFATQFGQPTDKAVPADYTGDGKADIAFWMPSNGFWYVLRSDDFSYYAFPFGGTTDVPVPADYDGDARVDAGVFRSSNSNWYISRSTAGLLIQQFGSAGDVPVPNAFVR